MNFEDKVYSFIDALNQFQYILEYNDRIWKVVFLHKKTKWHKIFVVKYQNT